MKYKQMKKQAEKVGGLKLLSPTFHEWKGDGDCIVGVLLGVATVKSSLSEGSYNQYLFETDDGHVKFHMGAATDKEIGGLLLLGHIYSVTYRGVVQISGKRSVNKFEVAEIEREAIEEKGTEEEAPF